MVSLKDEFQRRVLTGCCHTVVAGSQIRQLAAGSFFFLFFFPRCFHSLHRAGIHVSLLGIHNVVHRFPKVSRTYQSKIILSLTNGNITRKVFFYHFETLPQQSSLLPVTACHLNSSLGGPYCEGTSRSLIEQRAIIMIERIGIS